MSQNYYNLSPNLIESNLSLIPYYCGSEDCEPGHYFGPAVRDHFLIHYILKGKGIFQIGRKVYHLEKGQGFLICPNIITYYKADMNDPWSYEWLAFYGQNAASYMKLTGLNENNPVFRYDIDDSLEDCFEQLFAASAKNKGRDLKLQSLLYRFLSLISESAGPEVLSENSKTRNEYYIKKAVEFIHMNYSRKTSIFELARHIGLDRKYLSWIFKNTLNTSPKEFLVNFRISKACELMENSMLSISDVSRSVGYDDPLLFSRIFKKLKGVSPREYRKQIV